MAAGETNGGGAVGGPPQHTLLSALQRAGSYIALGVRAPGLTERRPDLLTWFTLTSKKFTKITFTQPYDDASAFLHGRSSPTASAVNGSGPAGAAIASATTWPQDSAVCRVGLVVNVA